MLIAFNFVGWNRIHNNIFQFIIFLLFCRKLSNIRIQDEKTTSDDLLKYLIVRKNRFRSTTDFHIKRTLFDRLMLRITQKKNIFIDCALQISHIFDKNTRVNHSNMGTPRKRSKHQDSDHDNPTAKKKQNKSSQRLIIRNVILNV